MQPAGVEDLVEEWQPRRVAELRQRVVRGDIRGQTILKPWLEQMSMYDP